VAAQVVGADAGLVVDEHDPGLAGHVHGLHAGQPAERVGDVAGAVKAGVVTDAEAAAHRRGDAVVGGWRGAHGDVGWSVGWVCSLRHTPKVSRPVTQGSTMR
jgi:hypothetical protein